MSPPPDFLARESPQNCSRVNCCAAVSARSGHSARTISRPAECVETMAVLVEGLSIVVLRDAIDSRYVGGWSRFLADVPAVSWCADDSLVSTSFAVPTDVKSWASILQVRGLRFLDGTTAVDFVVVHQLHGPTSPCEWLRFGAVRTASHVDRLSACHHVDSTSRVVVIPAAWRYEQSLSRQVGEAQPLRPLESFEHLRHHDGRQALADARREHTVPKHGLPPIRSYG